MAVRTELNLRLPNSPGALGRVCRALSDERVNVLAMALDAQGQLRLVVDNHVHASGLLRDQHYQVTEHEVVVVSVPNGPGALASILKLVTDAGINVDYAYGSGLEGTAAALIVLGLADARKAAALSGL